MTSKPRLRWRRKKREKGRGTYSVVAIHRGWELVCGDRPVATVAKCQIVGQPGYYWHARCDALDIPFCNTAHRRLETMEEAKTEALAYVKRCLGEAK